MSKRERASESTSGIKVGSQEEMLARLTPEQRAQIEALSQGTRRKGYIFDIDAEQRRLKARIQREKRVTATPRRRK